MIGTLDYSTNSLGLHLRECIENSMENTETNIRV